MKLKLAICLLLPLNLWAATWERPAGAYTPTNHSVNITKYQTDSANHIAISSAKVDGDINKAFQGLNDLESRTPPSVTGNSNKFLTNNGSSTSWGLVSTSGMSSGVAAAGYVLQANGSGGVGWGLVSTTALGGSGVISGTYIFSTIKVNTAGLVVSASGSATPTLIGVTVSGVVTASTAAIDTVSASIVSASAYYGPGAPKAIAFIGGQGSCSVYNNVLNVSSCQNISAGNYGVSFTVPLSNTNYVPMVTTANISGASIKATLDYQTASPTTAGFRVRIENSNTGSGVNTGVIMVVVY